METRVIDREVDRTGGQMRRGKKRERKGKCAQEREREREREIAKLQA